MKCDFTTCNIWTHLRFHCSRDYLRAGDSWRCKYHRKPDPEPSPGNAKRKHSDADDDDGSSEQDVKKLKTSRGAERPKAKSGKPAVVTQKTVAKHGSRAHEPLERMNEDERESGRVRQVNIEVYEHHFSDGMPSSPSTRKPRSDPKIATPTNSRPTQSSAGEKLKLWAMGGRSKTKAERMREDECKKRERFHELRRASMNKC